MGNYCSRETLYETGSKDRLSSDIMQSAKLWRHTRPGGVGRQKTLTNEMTVVDLVISGTQIYLHYGAQSQSFQNLFEIISL